MLKKRLIPVLFIKNGLIVRSEKFTHHKIIGNVINEVKRYNQWNVDEIIYIDISREKIFDSRRDDHKVKNFTSLLDILKNVASECFMPLSFGGGIRTFETIEKFLRNGADKVIVNTLAFEDSSIIKKAVQAFGSQAVVLSLDYKLIDNKPIFFSNNGTVKQDIDYLNISNFISELGVGEVLLNSINKDGSGDGYDLDFISLISNMIEVPIIACGGAASSFDFMELASLSSVSGIAAGNMFHFTENAYPRAKQLLKNKGFDFR